MSKFWEQTKQFMGFVEEEGDDYSQRVMTKKPLVNIAKGNKQATFGIKVIEPRDSDQSLEIANALREGVPVVLNLKYLESNESKRLFDFICGTTYAIEGHFRKLGDNILLFTPSNINIVDAEAENQFKEMDMDRLQRSSAKVMEY